MSERRYSEDEVSTIFERATEAQQAVRRQLPAGGEGMTLAELRSIGKEVGIPAELVDQAARSVDTGGRDATRTFLGLPLGVGRTVELGRRLTDDEWERLVVDLRETFDARGVVRSEGSLKQWTNGNLQALLEPTASGHRLRLKTMMGAARGMMMIGMTMVGASAAIVVAAAVSGNVSEALAQMGSLMVGGAAMFTMGAARLPRWANLRRRQMEGVAARLALETETKQIDGSNQFREDREDS
jgi:hypothetical protein